MDPELALSKVVGTHRGLRVVSNLSHLPRSKLFNEYPFISIDYATDHAFERLDVDNLERIERVGSANDLVGVVPSVQAYW